MLFHSVSDLLSNVQHTIGLLAQLKYVLPPWLSHEHEQMMITIVSTIEEICEESNVDPLEEIKKAQLEHFIDLNLRVCDIALMLDFTIV